MSNIDIANSFFSYYASAATDNVAAYRGMHQHLDDNVTFSDMAYGNIKGKRVFAMWHWFCTKKPEPVKVTFDPSKTIEKDGIVIPDYQAKYDLKRGWTMLFKNLSLVIRASTSNLYFMSHKMLPICICFALAFLLFGCATPTPDTEDFSPNFLPVNNTSNPKNIFVFMDGTSNNSKVPTNIYRLFQEIKKNNDNRTVARYIEGVGNAEDPLDSTLGIAGSFGMEDRILQGYEFITQHYKPKSETYPGDRIYIFGFSRGAHTARSLAGLISYAGVPKVSEAELNNKDDLIDIGNDILELTKDELDSEHANDWEKWQPGDKPILTELIRENKIINKKGREVQPAEVEFLGVWDTVPGSLFKDRLFGTYPDLACKESIGFIKSTWGFKHIAHLFGVSYGERYKIDSYPAIHHIAHAVSKDEKRSMFRPLFLCSKALNTSSVFKEKSTTLKEVAFPGAHADVGGGYDDKNNQLPDISLNWMIDLLDKHYPLPSTDLSPPKSHQFINASNADPNGLAHLSISDPDGNTGSECRDRNLDSITKDPSIMVRKNAGAVPWVVFGKHNVNPDQSCRKWVKPIRDVKQENIECIKQKNIMCMDLKLNGWIK